MKLAYRSPKPRSSLPDSADCASMMMSCTAFSAASARREKEPQRALSEGISVRDIHLPLT